MSRHALHLLQEGGERCAREMVRHLVAGDDVDAAGGERERQRRAADGEAGVPLGPRRQRGIDVEGNRLQL